MKGYVDNIEKATLHNGDFRRVLYTGHHLQLVAMAINAGDAIGEEVHHDRDQFFRINNTKPLPRGLVTELLPNISSPLPPRLAIKQG